MPSLGPNLPLSPHPCLLPPAGWAGPPPASSSLELLCPFVLRMASSVFGRLIFSLSLAIPRKLPPIALRAFRPGPYPKQCRHSSPCCPHLLVEDVGVRGTFLMGVAFKHVICGFYLFFLPVRLPSEIRKLPQTRP